MGTFVKHIPCEACGSSDANALYDDGSTYCFACLYTEQPKETEGTQDRPKDTHKFLTGTYSAIPNRGLTEETCRKFGYTLGDGCHIANYRDPKSGSLVAQKIRKAGKNFSVLGGGKDMPLFGQHLWGSNGKSVVITEGEIDALSVAQAFNLKWPVVSLPNGAQSALAAIKNAWEWLCGFEKIVLCFDMDTPGREACEKVAQALPSGKAFIMRMPDGYKDANDVLVKLGTAPITQAYWNAALYRPDGVITFSELKEAILNPKVSPSIPYPWLCLEQKTLGIRKGELVTVTAGSGLGKSTFVKEILYDLAVNHNKPVGLIFLEEQGVRTAETLIGMRLNKNLITNRDIASPQEIQEAYEFLATKRISLFSHFGSNDVDTICSKIRFMVQCEGVEYVFLDHLSILISDSEGDERKLIDATMTRLRTLVSELGFSLFIISHLKRPSGDKGHEDGVPVSLGQLRGSHAIAQLSDFVIGIQKNPESPTDDAVEVVVLKNRLSGERGSCGVLRYNRVSGRLTESAF